MSVPIGAFIGWFFGMLVASLFAANSRLRGSEDAEELLRAMERQVERDERIAALVN